MNKLEKLDELWNLFGKLEDESYLLTLCDVGEEDLPLADPRVHRSAVSRLIWRLDRHLHELGDVLSELLEMGFEPPEAIT